MTRQRKIVLAKAAMVMGTLPVLLWAYEYGPDPGYAACRMKTAERAERLARLPAVIPERRMIRSNKGSVAVNFPNGMTYTPGVTQTLSVTITDSTKKAAGFELTARQASSTSTMAGDIRHRRHEYPSSVLA